MASPDLSSRVQRHDEDLQAISDTVIEIKDVVDSHTTTLAEHGRQLGEIQQEQEQQAVKLTEIEQQVTEGFAAIMAALREQRQQ